MTGISGFFGGLLIGEDLLFRLIALHRKHNGSAAQGALLLSPFFGAYVL